MSTATQPPAPTFSFDFFQPVTMPVKAEAKPPLKSEVKGAPKEQPKETADGTIVLRETVFTTQRGRRSSCRCYEYELTSDDLKELYESGRCVRTFRTYVDMQTHAETAFEHGFDLSSTRIGLRYKKLMGVFTRKSTRDTTYYMSVDPTYSAPYVVTMNVKAVTKGDVKTFSMTMTYSAGLYEIKKVTTTTGTSEVTEYELVKTTHSGDDEEESLSDE